MRQADTSRNVTRTKVLTATRVKQYDISALGGNGFMYVPTIGRQLHLGFEVMYGISRGSRWNLGYSRGHVRASFFFAERLFNPVIRGFETTAGQAIVRHRVMAYDPPARLTAYP